VASSFIAAIPSHQATVMALSTAAIAASVSSCLRRSHPSAAALQPDIAFIHHSFHPPQGLHDLLFFLSCVGEVAFTCRLQCLVRPHMGLYDSFLWDVVLVCGFYYLPFSFINFYRLGTWGAAFVLAVLAATCAASFYSLYAIQI
jgi:hypothetical protein